MPYRRAVGGLLTPLGNSPPSTASLSSFLLLCPPLKGRPQPLMPREGQVGPISCTGQTEIKQFHLQATPQMYHTRAYLVTHEPRPCVHAQTGFSLPQHMVGSPSPYLTSGSNLCLQDRALVQAKYIIHYCRKPSYGEAAVSQAARSSRGHVRAHTILLLPDESSPLALDTNIHAGSLQSEKAGACKTVSCPRGV